MNRSRSKLSEHHWMRYQIPQWYKDAEFGILIHRDAYSVPASGSEWYPSQMYIDAKRWGDNIFKHPAGTYGHDADIKTVTLPGSNEELKWARDEKGADRWTSFQAAIQRRLCIKSNLFQFRT